MILYHGTSSTRVDLIMRDGLRPGSEVAADGLPQIWPDAGEPGKVYLTDSQAAAFGWALHAAARAGGQPVVLEVETEEHEYSVPDDNFFVWGTVAASQLRLSELEIGSDPLSSVA